MAPRRTFRPSRHAAINLVGRALVLFGLTLAAGSCSPNLGDAPFFCNPGNPHCPDGYQCNGANVCVPEGTCPDGVVGCPTCGDGECAVGEDCKSCPGDCGLCTGACGDGQCDASAGESCGSCEADCGACNCGNGTCDSGEDKDSCPADCSGTVTCGDGTCEGDETATTCPQDCVTNTCGNGTCDNGETTATCAEDCPAPGVCGNGKCDGDETSETCSDDCFCKEGTTNCRDSAAIMLCASGRWKTVVCSTHCQDTLGVDSLGCEFSTADDQDACICDVQ
ncbi:MAG: hypothetical protein JRH20_17415 [Deltaproteobacteria bacterium]|nr:hypothetical protein [Deltaproteobacteria bacterium]